MHIVFGWKLDGSSYPLTATGSESAIGQPVVGPSGLVGLLETALGLAGPTLPAAVRIARYLGRLRTLDDGARFYTRSFARDSWSTAKQLMVWRDELYAAGWRGQPIKAVGARLDTMALIESVNDLPLGTSLGERLQAVLNDLRDGAALPIERIEVVSPEEHFPPLWRRLLTELRMNGVDIHVLEAPRPMGASDLAAIQRSLNGDEASKFTGDGSLVILDAEDEWQAADAVAAWLASGDNDETVIIRGEGSLALDAACQRLGLPRPGWTESSAQRSALQVLPLALEMLWEPIEPARILEFLSLPRCPLPRFVSRRFAKALMQEPGIGGKPWTDAWQTCVNDLTEKKRGDGLDDSRVKKEVEKAQAEWRFWLEPQRFRRTYGIPVQAVQRVCNRIAQWSAGIAQSNDDPLFRTAASHAVALSEAIAALGSSHVTPVQLGRIIDAVIAEGAAAPAATEDAAPWSVVDQPGQLWGMADSLVWWEFAGDVGRSRQPPWSDVELAALTAADIHIEPIEDTMLREAASWRQAFLNARARAILVMPRQLRGDAADAHPLWHEIFSQLEPSRAVPKARFPSRSIAVSCTTRLAGRVIKRQAIDPLLLPSARRNWTLPASALSRRPQESITSIKTLIECPLAWALHYGARIRPSVLSKLPEDEQLVGVLAHAVVERLFAQRKNWPPDDAANEAKRLFDSLAPAIAAPLLRPGYVVEYERAKTHVSSSIGRLVRMISDADLTVRGCEEEVVVSVAPGRDFGGYLDLVLEDSNGRSVVLDLKWSKRDKYRREEIEEGRALQLAAYAWLEEQAGRTAIGAGYFMLRQQTLFFTSPHPFPAAHHVPGSDLKQTWDRLKHAYDHRMAQLEQGEILVRGVEPGPDDADMDPMPKIKPGCRFCDYRPLCGASFKEGGS